MKKRKRTAFLCAGLLFSILGLIILACSIFTLCTCDRISGTISFQRSGTNRIAYVSYTYSDVLYERKALSGYNAFTMKDGKESTVYIAPDKPDDPRTTSFLLGTLCLLTGGFTCKVCLTREPEEDFRKPEM